MRKDTYVWHCDSAREAEHIFAESFDGIRREVSISLWNQEGTGTDDIFSKGKTEMYMTEF